MAQKLHFQSHNWIIQLNYYRILCLIVNVWVPFSFGKNTVNGFQIYLNYPKLSIQASSAFVERYFSICGNLGVCVGIIPKHFRYLGVGTYLHLIPNTWFFMYQCMHVTFTRFFTNFDFVCNSTFLVCKSLFLVWHSLLPLFNLMTIILLYFWQFRKVKHAILKNYA